jgi:hypothetical protein
MSDTTDVAQLWRGGDRAYCTVFSWRGQESLDQIARIEMSGITLIRWNLSPLVITLWLI